MYTKVFRQIYDGTLADNWQALITFQQLLILADDDGVVDMTVAAIHRTTGIPLEHLEQGIKVLEAPDHGSRTPDMEGRRIARLDEHRPWGWFLVNFRKYRQMQSREDKKEADRARMAEKRAAGKSKEISSVADSRAESRGVAEVAHTEAYTDTKAEKKQEQKTCVEPSREGSLLTTDSPTAITLTLNTGTEHPITEAQVAEFSRLHPAIDVMQELRNMRAWCIGNPSRRKTRSGILKFVVAWLSKAQNDPRVAQSGNRGPPRRPSVSDRISDQTWTGTPEHEFPAALRHD